MRKKNRLGPVKFFLVTLAAGLLSGCASSFAPSPVADMQVPIGYIQGNVHGGNLPVSGAHIYLYQSSTSGYGTAATSLICNSSVDTNPCPTAGTYGPFKDGNNNYYVVTDANGNFALGGDYMCTVDRQEYMVATGGNPGLGSISTTATFSKNSYTITVGSASNVNVGAYITGTGVGGTVTAVSGTTVTLSQQTTAAGSAASVAFSVDNPAIVQMAGLGNCPPAGNTAATVPYLVINEVTTVGFAYAMGGFATTPYNVSSDASGATGLANAMQNFLNIVNVAKGQAYGPTVPGNPNSVSPRLKINALANILSTCVNQTNSTASSCQNLFQYATTQSGTKSTDEATAIFNIVHNQAVQIGTGTAPTQNATNLYNLVTGNEPFLPFLGSAPTDWTMPVIYNSVISPPVTSTTTNTITSGPYNIVFDASGDAWIGDRVNGVIEIAPQGALTTFSNLSKGFSMVKGVAVSPQDGTIWVSDFGNNKIDVMNSAGTIVYTNIHDLTGNGPASTVFALNPISGGDYQAYEVDETVPGIVTFDAGSPGSPQIHYAGNANGGTDYTGVSKPGWIYVDSTGTVWIPSTNTDYAGELAARTVNGVTKYATTDLFFGASYTTIPEQLGMAADGLGNVWAGATVQNVGTGLYRLLSGNATGSWTGGGMNVPYKTFVDGDNSIWVANGGANTVSGFNSTTATWMSSVGFSTSAAAQTGCLVLAVDPSGNVWTGNSDQSVTQLLGLATPTAAPLYGGRTVTTTAPSTSVSTNGNLGTKP